MRSGIEPLFVTFSYTDSNAVTHIKWDCHFTTLGSVDCSFSQHWHVICYGYIIVGSEDGFNALCLTQLFDNGENTVTNYLMVIQSVCLGDNHIGEITAQSVAPKIAKDSQCISHVWDYAQYYASD